MRRWSMASRRGNRWCSSESPRHRRCGPRTRAAFASGWEAACPVFREPEVEGVAVAPAEEEAAVGARGPRMLLGETLNVALESLRANKLRSFLTMLGIVIGVGAVIAMVALGRGAQQSVKERIASLGTTLLTVMPSQARGAGGVASSSERALLTMGDAKAVEDRSTFVAALEPEMSRQLQVQYENRNTNTSIVGTTANYLEVRKFTIAAGRMFTEPENAARRRVAVVRRQILTS